VPWHLENGVSRIKVAESSGNCHQKPDMIACSSIQSSTTNCTYLKWSQIWDWNPFLTVFRFHHSPERKSYKCWTFCQEVATWKKCRWGGFWVLWIQASKIGESWYLDMSLEWKRCLWDFESSKQNCNSLSLQQLLLPKPCAHDEIFFSSASPGFDVYATKTHSLAHWLTRLNVFFSCEGIIVRVFDISASQRGKN
jgi:hypothetical protein